MTVELIHFGVFRGSVTELPFSIFRMSHKRQFRRKNPGSTMPLLPSSSLSFSSKVPLPQILGNLMSRYSIGILKFQIFCYTILHELLFGVNSVQSKSCPVETEEQLLAMEVESSTALEGVSRTSNETERCWSASLPMMVPVELTVIWACSLTDLAHIM